MVMKRIWCLLLTVLLVMVLSFSAMAETAEVISLGRISVTMPEVILEIKGTECEAEDVSSSLDSENLSITDVAKFDVSKDSLCTYILIDLSTSMRSSFEVVKNNVISYMESLSDDDKVVLITFGETEVNTVLTGVESREDAIEVVKQLDCNENGTMFYEALSKAYQLSNSSNSAFDREFVVAFSDGIDLQKGNTTFNEVLNLYNSHKLPLYAACSHNASKEAADKFGEMARASGGAFSLIENQNDFAEFLSEINDVTIVRLRASSNRVDGKTRYLTVKVGEQQVDCNVPVVRSIPDMDAPTVQAISYDIDRDVFVISFSEAILGGASANSYKITDSKGEIIEVSEVFSTSITNTYEIKTKNPVTKGTYTFDFSGIKDDSQEQNPLSGVKTIAVEKTNNHGTLSAGAIVLIVVGVLLVIAIIVVVLVVISSKNKKNQNEGNDDTIVPVKSTVESHDYIQAEEKIVKHHIKADDSMRIRLVIKTGKTSEQTIDATVMSSLIVGRSNVCDIYIDDTKLSRQHFVIENDSGTLYIMDLQSRNGTLVNGIRINNRQHLSSGDKILAGLSDIIITIIGR